MRVAFRVDASPAIGTGHLRRSLSLAQALCDHGAEVVFVTRDLGIDSKALIAELGFGGTITLLSPRKPVPADRTIPHSEWAEVSQQRDIADTIAALDDFDPDWVVKDSYAFDERWHEAVREKLSCRIAQIDDVPDRRIAPDLLIDHNHASDHRAKYADCLTGTTKILGGPRFALLGPAFAQAERYGFNDEVRSIGIFMGGVDVGNHSATALDALDEVAFSGAVEIVTTSSNPHLAELEQRISQRPHTDLSLDLPDLAEFFARHDLQIGAGGGATWERCCIGVPTILVVLAPNQKSVAPYLAELGIVALAAEPTKEAIADQMRELLTDGEYRRDLAERSRALVDGRGAQRVALALLAETLAIRAAEPEDSDLLFAWRNHEATRTFSRESDEVEPDEHRQWFDRVMRDPSRRLFVATIADHPVGIIRFDFSSETRAEVSLYLDPDLHGLGLGPHLLLAGETASQATTVDAVVLTANRASQRLFERCGYRQTTPERWVKHL
ncbi:MAG: UDP-2,4-diacetamido-2,4,6-trideoxy-beta-L-altropyranose hydrolase [Erythrobacter sp.]